MAPVSTVAAVAWMLAKTSENSAVGVAAPQKDADAADRTPSQWPTSRSVRKPCRKRHDRQAGQSPKYDPRHMHCWCAARKIGPVPLGVHVVSMVSISTHGGMVSPRCCVGGLHTVSW